MSIDINSTNTFPSLLTTEDQDPLVLNPQKTNSFLTSLISFLHQGKRENSFKRINPEGAPVLEKPSMKFDAESLTLLLIRIRAKMGQQQAATSKEEIEIAQISKQHENNKILEKINENLEAMKKAKEKNILGKIFGWLATIITAVAAVALTVATAGAAAPMIAVAAVMLTDQILQETTDKGIAGHMADGLVKLGMDEDAAQIFASITYAVAMVAATVAATVATGGAAASALVNTIKNVAAMASACAQLGAGATGIAKGFDIKAAMDAKADQLDIRAIMKKIAAMMEAEMQRLEEIISSMDDGMSKLLSILGNVTETDNKIIGNMGMRKAKHMI